MAFVLWSAWTKVWIPDGPVWATVFFAAFTLFGLFIVARNIWLAWFRSYDGDK